MANKGNLFNQFRKEATEAGLSEGQIHYAREICREYNQDYIDQTTSHVGGVDSSLENLTSIIDLGQPIDDERFKELLESTTDAIPIIAEHKLTHEQISQLSKAERQQYRDIRSKLFSEQKATLSHGQTNFELQMENEGLKSEEESNKKSTIIPPKGIWGTSDTYYYIKGVAERFDTISKYLQDIAKQVYVFKLSKEIDKNSKQLLESYHDERMLPLWEVALTGSEEIINILENIQDEKNRDTALGWMKKGMDKHWNYGNHGAGEVDYIQTGEYIFRLGKENNVVVRVPIKREFTREQVGDKTTVKLEDLTNQVYVHCPNHIDLTCAQCKGKKFYINRMIKHGPKAGDVEAVIWNGDCGLEWNVPIVGDEERDLFAGDLFYKATNILLENELSKAMEEICDNAIYVPHLTPEEWLHRKGIPIKDKITVYEEKPEKIKTENLDPKDRAMMGYNIFWGRAHRTADKSEHFSNEA